MHTQSHQFRSFIVSLRSPIVGVVCGVALAAGSVVSNYLLVHADEPMEPREPAISRACAPARPSSADGRLVWQDLNGRTTPVADSERTVSMEEMETRTAPVQQMESATAHIDGDTTGVSALGDGECIAELDR